MNRTNTTIAPNLKGPVNTAADDGDVASGVNSGDDVTASGAGVKRMTYWEKLRDNNALLIDVASRVMFPVMFLLFNITYWVHYAM